MSIRWLTSPGGGGTIGNSDLLNTLSAYTLLTASQMRDSGLNIQTLFGINPGSTDFYGVLIPQNGAFDVGASEFVVPEPASIGMLALFAGVMGTGRRRRRRA